MLTAAGPADPVATHERLAARLAAGDVAQGGVQLVELGVQEVDRAQGQVHGLAGDGGQLEAGQPGAALIGEQPGAFRQAVVVQHGVDALMPGGALVHERFAQPHLGADVSDVGGRDPGLGQRPTQQQVTQVVGVGPVGLGPPLGAAQRPGVGRLRQMGAKPGAHDLLGDIPPAGQARPVARHGWRAGSARDGPARCRCRPSRG
jgi:hypothetical protein